VDFNYSYQNTGSVVADYACIFENNHVGTISGQHMGWPGGVYIQDAQCVFSACSFLGNTSVTGSAALFLITPYPIEISDCEFAGNLTGGTEQQPSFPGTAVLRNVSYHTPETPIAVLALKGRWPGVPAVVVAAATIRPVRRAAEHHAAVAPVPEIPRPVLRDRTQLTRWDAVVLAGVRRSLALGRSPRFLHHRMHVEIAIVALDADGTIHGTMPGGEIQLTWGGLEDADRLDLISDCARDVPGDQACLAFYELLIQGPGDAVYQHLTAAGSYAREVLTAFGIADLTELAHR